MPDRAIHIICRLTLGLLVSCQCESHPPPSPAHRVCPPTCSGSGCDGCDPQQEHCDANPVFGQIGVARWPDPNIGPDYVNAAVHRTSKCGSVKWPFATTNHMCRP